MARLRQEEYQSTRIVGYEVLEKRETTGEGIHKSRHYQLTVVLLRTVWQVYCSVAKVMSCYSAFPLGGKQRSPAAALISSHRVSTSPVTHYSIAPQTAR